MTKSKKKPNNLNLPGVQSLKRQLDEAFPVGPMRKAGFIQNSDPLGLTNDLKFKEQFVGAAIEIRNEDVNIRVYRKPDSKHTHDYDVDEIHRANQPVISRPAKSEIEGHWLGGNLPDDLMRRNNITVELVPDGAGGMSLNVKPEGTALPTSILAVRFRPLASVMIQVSDATGFETERRRLSRARSVSERVFVWHRRRSLARVRSLKGIRENVETRFSGIAA
jgi:hypothetical protein